MLRTHGADVPGPHVRSAWLAGASRASSTTDGDGRRLFTVFLLTVALWFGVVAVARADVVVVFDDPNLRSAVVSQLVAQGRIPQGSDGTTITPSDMQALTTLLVPDRGIARLEGLEDAVDLRSLDLGGNEIADITPLAGLNNLTDLDVVRNKLDATAGSSAMTAIAALEACGAHVSRQPQRAVLSRPTVSSSAATYGRRVTFSVTVAPRGAASMGASGARLYHLETKTVTKTIDGRSRKVAVDYWRLRRVLSTEETSTGALSVEDRLPYAGKWQVRFTHAGSADYESCTSTAHTFVVHDPRIEAAIRWALNRRGAHAWDHYCMRFVNDAYERGAHAAVIRYRTAKQAASALRASAHRGGNPPRGAYVFYDSWHGSADLGHVGISLGNGTMIHDYGSAGVRITPIRISLHYVGWAAPPLSPGITDWKTPPAS